MINKNLSTTPSNLIDFKNKVLVFDCDGVLIESVSTKMEAFRQWVPKKHATFTDEFSEYNKSAFGKSRFVQIKYFYETIVGESITDDKWHQEVERFAKINLSNIYETSWVKGAKSFLENAHSKNIPLFVLSGTPQQELEQILKHKKVFNLFDKIIGSPTTKEEGLLKVIQNKKCEPSDVIFFGDATKDYIAASSIGTRFIYRISEADFLGENPDMTINNFLEI